LILTLLQNNKNVEIDNDSQNLHAFLFSKSIAASAH